MPDTRNSYMSALQLKLPPPVAAAFVALVMWLVASLPSAAQSTPLQLLLGGPIALVGGLISATGILSFWLARTTINPMHPERSSSLVTSGVFRLSRNPMYLGLVITLAGWAIHLPLSPALLGPPAFALYIHHFQILPEERILASMFGAEYESYKAKARRWL
ncbi:MAG: isoprenylcysteine carboxylmethyltransferase family protein [Betaproteobacteria bacterium HGW-Betaproteobacteria-13]|jgi:protein-S-isoprenylcysteine O-methyltransferase Ste14|uniref:Isoprenylcysteine carboxyl methyltransferase n=2 Tax=Parazoarcus communis TaxID=41977 RepID=A0A2U8H639_9RHOO|nr:isoprenylcysteine carboxyl methyltransferase [Parazoarcus communis]PKO82614.1 MAG: isoprenylcysteine carboxylmethyltransferase family protein [Betaproteobacteria bacterium HGW-Betaproteobacteria-13]